MEMKLTLKIWFAVAQTVGAAATLPGSYDVIQFQRRQYGNGNETESLPFAIPLIASGNDTASFTTQSEPQATTSIASPYQVYYTTLVCGCCSTEPPVQTPTTSLDSPVSVSPNASTTAFTSIWTTTSQLPFDSSSTSSAITVSATEVSSPSISAITSELSCLTTTATTADTSPTSTRSPPPSTLLTVTTDTVITDTTYIATTIVASTTAFQPPTSTSASSPEADSIVPTTVKGNTVVPTSPRNAASQSSIPTAFKTVFASIAFATAGEFPRPGVGCGIGAD